MFTRHSTLLFVLAALLVGCSQSATLGDGDQAQAGTAEPSAARADAAAEDVAPAGELAVSLLAPATAADLRAVAVVDRTSERAFATAMEQCVAEQGFSVGFVTQRPLDATPRYADFPDLQAIDKYGLAGPPVDVVGSEWDRLVTRAEDPFTALSDSDISDAEWEQLNTAAGECQRELETTQRLPIDEFRVEHDAITEQWYDLMRSSQVDGSPAVEDARSQFVDCVRQDGFSDVTTEEGFLAATTGIESRAADRDEAEHLARSHADIYVRCMEPLLRVRDEVRLDARANFAENNFAAFTEAETDLRAALRDLGL